MEYAGARANLRSLDLALRDVAVHEIVEVVAEVFVKAVAVVGIAARLEEEVRDIEAESRIAEARLLVEKGSTIDAGYVSALLHGGLEGRRLDEYPVVVFGHAHAGTGRFHDPDVAEDGPASVIARAVLCEEGEAAIENCG